MTEDQWGLAKGLRGQYLTVWPHMRIFSKMTKVFLLRGINGFWQKDGTGAICCSQGIKATDGAHEDKAAKKNWQKK